MATKKPVRTNTTKTTKVASTQPDYLKYVNLHTATHAHLKLDKTLKARIKAQAAKLGVTQATVLNAYCALGMQTAGI